MCKFSFLCSIRILSNIFYNCTTKVSKFIESTRQHKTLISTTSYYCVLDGHKDLLDFHMKFYLFCIRLFLFQPSARKLTLPSQRTHVRTIITKNHSRHHIASLYVTKPWGPTSEMKVWFDLGRLITHSHFWLASSVSWYLTVLQRVQIRDGRSVLSVWVWTRI